MSEFGSQNTEVPDGDASPLPSRDELALASTAVFTGASVVVGSAGF